MKAPFASLRLNRRLFLIRAFYSVPLAVLLYQIVQSNSADIDFARSEITEHEYRQPLLALLEVLPQHQLAPAAERAPLAAQIDNALGQVKTAPAAVGQAWREIKSAAAKDEVTAAPSLESVRARYFHLITNVRTMLAQADEAAMHERVARQEQLRAQQNLQLGAAAGLVFVAICLVWFALAGLAKAIAEFNAHLSVESARVSEKFSQLESAGKLISGTAQAQAVALEELSSSLEEMTALTQRTAARAAAAKNISAAEANELLAELANATAEQHLSVAQINAAVSNLNRGAQVWAADAANHLAATTALQSAVGEFLGEATPTNFPAEPFLAAEKNNRRVSAPVAGRANVPGDSKNADAECHNL